MKNGGDQSLFRDYDDYIDYQVNKCVTPIDHPYYKGVSESHLRIITEYLSDADRAASILDCGCGYGFALKAFRNSGFTNVTGVDVSDDRLSAAKEAGYPVMHVDMHQMKEFPDGHFDVVYSSHSLEHSLHPERALAEISRIIKPGGHLMLVLPYPVMLDDEHVAKAHCGAEALGLTVTDGGDTLVRTVEAFGLSLLSRGVGAYRDEAEIYLKFVKGGEGLVVKDYGPKAIGAKEGFNVQPNGQSAMWFLLGHPYDGDVVVEFDGYYLKSALSGNMLSALVPDTLLEIPREVTVRIFDTDRPRRQVDLRFVVTGSIQNRRPASVRSDIHANRKPNFFLIGAPRSGTTVMYWALASHPDIFMTKLKEPFFFDERAHGLLTNAVTSEKDYLDLFRYAPMQASILGEASTTYLSSSDALRKIRSFSDEARALAMLRNPIDSSISMYLQMRRGSKYESLPDFETAWRQKSSGRRPFVTNYAELFQIGRQLCAAEAIFGKGNMKVVLFDDLLSQGECVYLDILTFLGLSAEQNKSLTRGNSSGHDNLRDLVSKEVLEEMIEHFRPEVEIVSEYTGRNLDHWLKS